MTAVKATFDISPLYRAVENILNRAGGDWYKAARKEAPVRQPAERARPGERSQAFAVRQIPVSQMTQSQKLLRRSLGIRPSTRAASVEALIGHRARSEAAKLFRYSEGPMKGQTPEILLGRKGGKLAGAEVTRGGTLRDGIELIPAVTEGNRVTIVLQNLVPYAGPQEYGFHHKGTGKIKGRRFMRGPRDQMIIPALRDGRYNRG